MKHEIEIEDGIIPEGYEVVRIGKAKKGDHYIDDDGDISVLDMSILMIVPIVRKITDPFEEVKDQLRHCFKDGTRFSLRMYGWCWHDPVIDHKWGKLPEESINWPDVPVGAEFEL